VVSIPSAGAPVGITSFVWSANGGSRAGPTRFHRGLERSGIRSVLDASLRILPADAQVGMSGAGLTIVNPPWMLDERLKELMPQLHRLLAPEGLGDFNVEWVVAE